MHAYTHIQNLINQSGYKLNSRSYNFFYQPWFFTDTQPRKSLPVSKRRYGIDYIL